MFLLAKRPSAAMSEKKRLPLAGYVINGMKNSKIFNYKSGAGFEILNQRVNKICVHISDFSFLRFIMNNATALQQFIFHSVSKIAKPH